jgi:hypothetical protein
MDVKMLPAYVAYILVLCGIDVDVSSDVRRECCSDSYRFVFGV